MKLILTREVAGLGNAGDVVTVKDGFGRNFLLPRAMQLFGQRVAKARSKELSVHVLLVRSAILIMQKRSKPNLNQQMLL